MAWQHIFRKVITLSPTSTTDVFIDLSDWVPSIGVDTAQAVLRISGNAGGQDVRIKLAVQAAAVRKNKPGSWTAYDSYQTGNGERATAVVSVASQINATQSFRWGLAYSLATAGTGTCTAELIVTWASVGEVVGTKALRIVTDSTTPLVEPVTGWFPAANIGKLVAAIIASACDNGLEWRLVYQTSATSPESAGTTWTAPSASYTAGAAELNTGLSTLTTTDMWVRVGIQVRSTASGTLVQGSFGVTTNARRT